MSQEYTIKVHTISEDGFPPRDYDKAGMVGRIAFIFDGNIYCGWPLRPMGIDDTALTIEDVVWEDGETARRFRGIKKWVELPVAGWSL